VTHVTLRFTAPSGESLNDRGKYELEITRSAWGLEVPS
jgi:hypothetical protein